MARQPMSALCRSSAEVLEAKHLAEAALHYARVTQAANETHADCVRILTRAEMRMADEIDKGQAEGQVPVRGQHAAHAQGMGMSELGLDSRRVAEWREIRDAGEDAVEGAIAEALDEGRAPTKADVLRRVRGKHVRGTFGTGEYEWRTPGECSA